MAMLTVIATLIAKPGCEQQVERVLREVVTPSRQDPGAVQYDLHRDLEHPEVFVFYENWASKALLAQHQQTPHLKQLQLNLDGLLQSFDMKLLEKIC